MPRPQEDYHSQYYRHTREINQLYRRHKEESKLPRISSNVIDNKRYLSNEAAQSQRESQILNKLRQVVSKHSPPQGVYYTNRQGQDNLPTLQKAGVFSSQPQIALNYQLSNLQRVRQ